MMRGRFVKIGATRAEDVKAKENAAWVLEGDRGVTYCGDAARRLRSSRPAQWWPKDYAGPPLVSMEEEIADGLGLKIGDPVTVNVLGRNIAATIANLRKVNWRSFAINFVLVYSPNTFKGAPHTFLVTAAFPKDIGAAGEIALQKEAAHDFPAVAGLRVRDALDQSETLVAKLAVAIRSASGVALSTSVLVLAGALAANRRTRIYDSVDAEDSRRDARAPARRLSHRICAAGRGDCRLWPRGGRWRRLCHRYADHAVGLRVLVAGGARRGVRGVAADRRFGPRRHLADFGAKAGGVPTGVVSPPLNDLR